MYAYAKFTVPAVGKLDPIVIYESIFYFWDEKEAIKKVTNIATDEARVEGKQVTIELKKFDGDSLTPAMAALRTRLWYEYDDTHRWLY